MEIEEVIKSLKQLRLSDYPKKEILDLFKELGDIGHIVVNLFPGFTVMRARPNRDGPRFTQRSQLSFKPAHINTTYQRASTPDQTMFYASLLPERTEPGELEMLRLIGFAETMRHIADKTICAYEKITYGKYEVVDQINLLAIIHKNDYYQASNYTRELVNAYEGFIRSAPKEFIERSLKFSEYISDEFSKETINDDYDYMISAMFAEKVAAMGLDGVLYPSVRVLGRGFNIALTPKAYEKLSLFRVGECSVYKRRDQTVVGNDAYAECDGTDKEFEWIDLENNEVAYLAELGVKSVKELKECR